MEYRDTSRRKYRRKLYRSRNGLLLGVCQGIAQWAALPVWLIRGAAILLALGSSFFPVGFAYLLGALLMEPEPERTYY